MKVKTHREVKQPRVSVSRLADYMAASEQAKRSILRSCKYQAITRVVQYNDAKEIIAEFLSNVNRDIATLQQKLERMKAKIIDDPFAAKVHEHNCDCVKRFIDIYGEVNLPNANLFVPRKQAPITLNGTLVSIQPQLLLTRTTRTNKIRAGAMMMRYQKGKPVGADTAVHQSAFIHGYLERSPFEQEASAERALCVVLDGHSGVVHEAPGNAVYLFNEMDAACASIAERWAAITPPAGAVL